MATPQHPRNTQNLVIGIVSELALWTTILAILGLILGYWSFDSIRPFSSHPSPRQSQDLRKQTTWVPFEDVNQLQVGSPVNFMGSDIGYVTKVIPKGTQVMVQFNTYADSVRLPQGAVYTIEFNGLAGAKSLEILPPLPGPFHTDQVIYQPIRIKDVFNTQQVMAEALESSMNGINTGLGDVSIFKAYPQKLQDINNHLICSSNLLAQHSKVMNAQAQHFDQLALNTAKQFNGFYPFFHQLELMTTPSQFKKSGHQFSLGAQDIYKMLSKAVSEKNVEQLHQQATERTIQLKAMETRFQNRTVQLQSGHSNINQWLANALTWLSNAQSKFTTPAINAHLHAWQQATNNWSVQSAGLNAKPKK